MIVSVDDRRLPPALQVLLDDVFATRAAQHEQLRQRGFDRTARASARWDELHALEAYAAALERRRWPVPRRMQQDMRLLRALCDARPD